MKNIILGFVIGTLTIYSLGSSYLLFNRRCSNVRSR